MESDTKLIPRLFAGDKWGRKVYLKRTGHEGEFKMLSVNYLKGFNWRQRTEAHLHQKISHSYANVSKRWRKAELNSLQHRVKNWAFYNRIHDTESSHGFTIVTI